MAKIMIIEDEKKLREELKIYLENNHYEVEMVTDFNNTLKLMDESTVDLILLDINLPNISGIDLCRNYRINHNTPIIMVTSQNDEMNELISINFGADDFISKPYNPLILLARIENILKRTTHSNIIYYHDVLLDVSKSIMKRNDKVLELSKNELKILYFLIINQGIIKSRDEIIDYLWDSEMFVDDNTLTVNINRLRNKLSMIDLKDAIVTKRMQGYMLK